MLFFVYVLVLVVGFVMVGIIGRYVFLLEVCDGLLLLLFYDFKMLSYCIWWVDVRLVIICDVIVSENFIFLV